MGSVVVPIMVFSAQGLGIIPRPVVATRPGRGTQGSRLLYLGRPLASYQLGFLSCLLQLPWPDATMMGRGSGEGARLPFL